MELSLSKSLLQKARRLFRRAPFLIWLHTVAIQLLFGVPLISITTPFRIATYSDVFSQRDVVLGMLATASLSRARVMVET